MPDPRHPSFRRRSVTNGLNLLLVGLLAVLASGCETVKDYSLTCHLWEKKNPSGSIVSSPDDKYIYTALTRSTLTPFTVLADTTVTVVVVGVVVAGVGAVACVYGLADACHEGAENGGRVSR